MIAAIDFSLGHGGVVALSQGNRRYTDTWEILRPTQVGFAKLTYELSKVIDNIPTAVELVLIEWSLNEVYWGNRKHSNLKTLLVGWITGTLQYSGKRVEFVSPRDVREVLGLRHNASKIQTHTTFIESYPDANIDGFNEDCLDAYIIAYLHTRGKLGVK